MRLDMKMIAVRPLRIDKELAQIDVEASSEQEAKKKKEKLRSVFRPKLPFDILDTENLTLQQLPEEVRNMLQMEDPQRGRHRAYVTQTHFRVKGHGMYTPSFWLTPEDGEDISTIMVGFGLPDDPAPRHFMKFLDEQDGARVFYDHPKGKYKDDGIGFDYANGATSASLGSVQAGMTDIFLVDAAHRVLEPARRLIVQPSGMTFAQLDRMVKEIISIRRELVQLDPKHQAKAKSELYGRNRKLLDETDFQQMLGIVAQNLEDITPFLEGMADRPRSHLIAEQEAVPVQSIKSMNGRIMRQYIENPARSKYTVAGARSTYDIYENRWIRSQLEKLLHYIRERYTQCIEDAAIEKKNLLYVMRQESGSTNVDDETDIQTVWKAKLEADRQELDRWKNKFRQDFDEKLNKVVRWREKELLGTSVDRVELCLETRHAYITYKIQDGCLSLLLKHTEERNEEGTKISDIPLTIKIPQGELNAACCEIKTSSYREMLAFLLTWETQLKRVEQNRDLHMEISGSIVCAPLKGRQDRRYVIYIHEIMQIRVDGNLQEFPNVTEKEALLEIREHNVMNLIMQNAQGSNAEHLLVTYQQDLQMKERWQTSQRVRDGLDNELCNNICKKIAHFLSMPVLQEASTCDEGWRMTQIFSNDLNYRSVCEGLQRLDELFDFSFEASVHHVIHEKIDVLYEYWILCRILKKLIIDEQWHPQDTATILHIFHEFFNSSARYQKQEEKNRKKGQAPHIDLTHELMDGHTLHMAIYYNASLYEALSEMPEDPPDRGRYRVKKLRPDYLFRLRIDEGEEKVFLLDAKYRKYETMGNAWLEEDLEEVCAYKYIKLPIEEGLLPSVQSAFIVHSDATTGMSNPNKYLGEYVTYAATLDERCIRFDEKINQDHPDRLIGSFFLTPQTEADELNSSSINLELYFQMIIEYYMGCWETCWHCGSTDVDIKMLTTEKGHPKFHMKCNHCQAFWVKNHCDKKGHRLIKHFINYLVEKGHERWYLRCPKCEANKLPKQ